MVAVESRRPAARLFREFAAGRLTNDEFEDAWPQSADPAIVEIFDTAWHLYDDLREHRLVGRDTLSPPTLAAVQRWIRFLETDLPYGWPRLRRGPSRQNNGPDGEEQVVYAQMSHAVPELACISQNSPRGEFGEWRATVAVS